MTWTAWQHRAVFDDLYNRCDKATQLSIDNRLARLLEKGNLVGRPVSAPLGDGIFELRGKSARFLYFFGPERRIIFAVGLQKDQRTVPKSAIDEAKTIKKELTSGKVEAHVVTQSN